MSRVGVLLIGGSGVIASALTAGLQQFKIGLADGQDLGMLTNDAPFDKLGLVDFKDIVLSGWDIKPSTPFETCLSNKVFHRFEVLKQLEDLQPIKIFDAILTPSDYLVSEGIVQHHQRDYIELVDMVRANIREFRTENQLNSVVILNISSPHRNIEVSDWHHNVESFEERLKCNDANITSSMLYCFAGLQEGCGFIEFTPSSTLDADALVKLAIAKKVPLAGRDGSTGQTLLKYVLSPMFKSRNLTVDGWYSTNILGNNDGKVLSHPDYSKSKMHDKSHGVTRNLGYPIDQIIDIRYLSNKKDNKESWDLIEFRGWMGEEMSVRINWNGKDSVLAAPLIFDLIRLIDYEKRHYRSGIQKQLGVYFKNPMGCDSRNFFELNEQFLNHYKKYIK